MFQVLFNPNYFGHGKFPTKGNKKIGKTFANYEAARSFLRKRLRKEGAWGPYANPAIAEYGYTIKHVS